MIMPIAGGVEECKRECNKNKKCTAIEFSDAPEIGKCCVLRSCPKPVPKPDVTQAEWHGSQFKYVGYTKGK